MKKFLVTASLIIFSTTTVFAQESVSDILGNTEEETVTVTEEELEETGDIKLKMPEQTDNPSYVITFIDPSEEESGVQLEIDGDRYVEIDSPYTLPALGIGNHILKFKYTDEEGATQTLEKQLIIIPRAPILNSPVIEENSVTLSGTGLANAELLLTISSGAKTYQYTTDIPENGTWSYIFEDATEEEIYSVQGITRRYGYSSNFSDVLTFEVGNVETISISDDTPISFSFKNFNSTALKSLTNENLDLLILTISLFFLGIILGVIFNSLLKHKKEKRSLGTFREKINGEKTAKEELTLRELFEKENGDKGKKKADEEKKEKETKEDKETKSEDKEETKEKETKVISKNEFLEVYKEFDPDTDEGKEKKKKLFKISLTSKK